MKRDYKKSGTDCLAEWMDAILKAGNGIWGSSHFVHEIGVCVIVLFAWFALGRLDCSTFPISHWFPSAYMLSDDESCLHICQKCPNSFISVMNLLRIRCLISLIKCIKGKMCSSSHYFWLNSWKVSFHLMLSLFSTMWCEFMVENALIQIIKVSSGLYVTKY